MKYKDRIKDKYPISLLLKIHQHQVHDFLASGTTFAKNFKENSKKTEFLVTGIFCVRLVFCRYELPKTLTCYIRNAHFVIVHFCTGFCTCRCNGYCSFFLYLGQFIADHCAGQFDARSTSLPCL